MKLYIFIGKLKIRTARLFVKSNWNLLKELIRARLKVSDHNSILGIFWSLISPIFMLLVMYFIFRTRFGKRIYAYPLYLLVGIVCVNFFITATTCIIKVFFSNREIILNSTVSRETLIISDIFIHAYKFIIEIILCLIISIFYNIFSWKFILLLPLLIGYFALILGAGLVVSLVYCFARDIEHLWMIASRLLLFATPIFYTLGSISPLARKIIYWLNPITPFLVSFREIIMGGKDISIFTYCHSLFLGGTFFIFGYYIFILFENAAVERS